MTRRTRLLLLALVAVCLAVFIFCAISLINYYSHSRAAQNTYRDLSAMVSPLRPSPENTDAETGPNVTPLPVYETLTDPDTGLTRQVLREYAPIYLLNSHTVGWIRISGTNIDHPVVQTPDRPNYYLRRDFYGNHNSHGCIYVKEDCSLDPASDNIVIYGHRMKDGTMFAALSDYTDPDFRAEHPHIEFDTLGQYHTYEVVYVMVLESSTDSEFQFQNHNDFASAEAFEAYLSYCNRYALYDTGIRPGFGDKLITLSTCDYSLENGRLVIIARQIK